MKRWDTIITARCVGCRVFMPTSEVELRGDGEVQCIPCGRRSLEWEVVRPALLLTRSVRWTFVATLGIVLCFFLAACVSQL